MRLSKLTRRVAGIAAASTVAISAHAQQTTYDFDSLAVGTVMTTQLKGVTFSAMPQSCSGSPVVSVVVGNPSGGTSSGTRAIGLTTGCPDFSPDYLRMVFDDAQSEVSFTLGDSPGTYVVRAYSTTTGSTGLISTRSIVVEGAGAVGVFRMVTVSSLSGNIRRIEIDDAVDDFEWIDDLTFTLDATAPIARIASPAAAACGCNSLTVNGSAYDPDDTYARDRLEYCPADSDTWTLIGSATTPQEDGILYIWNNSALAEGFYYIRLTVENTAGLAATDTALVWISGNFDPVSFSVPSIVGGNALPAGTVLDQFCTGSYKVEYVPSGMGLYQPIDAAHPTYPGYAVNQTLGVWNTRALPDGNYFLRVTGVNGCADADFLVRALTVDNTVPVAAIASPMNCAVLPGASVAIIGTVTDTHLAGWTLQYTGGASHGWTTIASGNTPVNNAQLGVWNLAALPDCDYTLRLVATDTAVLDGNSALRNQTEYTIAVYVGCTADFNRSGAVSVQDIFDFLAAYFAACP